MIRVLVVDDEMLTRERIVGLLKNRAGFEVIGECGDGRFAVQSILRRRPELVFLDVEMPELDGFEVIEAVRREYLPAVIFVTAYDHYAVRAFDVSAMDYLLKPIREERFDEAIRRALQRTAMQPKEASVGPEAYATRFVARLGSRQTLIDVSDVDWIDGADNYVCLHVGGREHFVRETMKSIERQLDPQHFIRIHRSTIINVERLQSVVSQARGEYSLTMKDGATLPVSRSYSERLRLLLRGKMR